MKSFSYLILAGLIIFLGGLWGFITGFLAGIFLLIMSFFIAFFRFGYLLYLQRRKHLLSHGISMPKYIDYNITLEQQLHFVGMEIESEKRFFSTMGHVLFFGP